MTTLKTISGRELKITSNQSKRHFTIKTDSAKFRTYPMSKEEFNECDNMTGNDWQQFLSATDDYYEVK